MKDARPYLVFFRAGSSSLHRKTLANDPKRNWDCCVSWYSQPEDETAAEYYCGLGDNKFEAFDDCYDKIVADSNYRYVLVVDDDIEFAPGDVSRFFTICESGNLYLAQPSLRWGTNANHDVTLRNPVCIVRQTRFVEVMAPCFSRPALERLRPTFRLNRSTWGIDYAWASMLAGEHRIAIVDAVQVDHTKPVSLRSGAFYEKLRKAGIDPVEEYAEVKRNYPRFGSLATESKGHTLAFPAPRLLVWPLVSLFESFKKRAHALLTRRSDT